MSYKKYLRVDPYVPDRTEALGDNTGQFSDSDLGKPVKLNAGGYCELCASGDEIYGFVSAVEAYTEGGHSVGSVSADVNKQAYAVDEAGGLAIGDLVVAGTPVALGTKAPNGGNVIAATSTPVIHKWMVVETYGGAAGDKVLLQKV